MVRTAKVITTDAQMDAALARARQFADNDRRAIRADYDQEHDKISLLLADGIAVSIPRKYLQGLENAKPSQLALIELLGGGTGLHWPKLDVSHYVPGLLSYIFGTKQWMTHLGHLGGISNSEAKKAAARANGLKGGRPVTRKAASTATSRKQATAKAKHGLLHSERRKKTA